MDDVREAANQSKNIKRSLDKNSDHTGRQASSLRTSDAEDSQLADKVNELYGPDYNGVKGASNKQLTETAT